MSAIPLHPLIVHFPIVLSVLLPLAAAAALLFGWRTGKPGKSWLAVLVLHALLLGSSFLAVQSGEKDEEKVETALASENPLETHEERAELFLKLSGAALAISALGLAPGALGLAGRALGSAGAAALLVLGIQVGHSGGELVYRHGAASAWATDANANANANADAAKAGASAEAESEGRAESREERDDD